MADVVQWLRRGPVAPETGVRFPPSAFVASRIRNNKKEENII